MFCFQIFHVKTLLLLEISCVYNRAGLSLFLVYPVEIYLSKCQQGLFSQGFTKAVAPLLEVQVCLKLILNIFAFGFVFLQTLYLMLLRFRLNQQLLI